jgi:hypothetical protein
MKRCQPYAEAATRLQLAAGVVVVKRGRNGRLYRRVVRCNLDDRVLEWASVGRGRHFSLILQLKHKLMTPTDDSCQCGRSVINAQIFLSCGFLFVAESVRPTLRNCDAEDFRTYK